MKTCIQILLPVLFSIAPVGGADWPQWRGPNRDGISAETGLLQDWPADGPPLLWKTNGLGEGYSGVSVANNNLCTMGDGSEGCFVKMLDATTGRLVWSARIGQNGGGGGYPGPRCTPTIDGRLVVALGQEGDLVCLETATGRKLWTHNLKDELGGRMMSGWGYSESPLVDGSLVVCTPGGPGGTLAAFDKQTGKIVWRSKQWTENAAYSSVIVAKIGDVRQYIQLTDLSVAGVAAADGALLWRGPHKGLTAVIPTPICDQGFVYVTSGYGADSSLFKITQSGGKFVAEQIYANKVMVNHHGGVLKVGDYLYGYSNGKGWTCQNFTTGQTVWQEKQKLGKGSICYADGRLYLRREDGKGTMALIEASPHGYVEHGRFDQPNRSSQSCWPHPVIAGGKLFIRDQDVLLCYAVATK
jgi:outer membrane protein assembly factor BamB